MSLAAESGVSVSAPTQHWAQIAPLTHNETPSRPEAAETPDAEAHAPTALMGTVIGGKTRFALLYDAQTQRVGNFRLGDLVAGWRLAEIAPDFVRLEKGEQQFVLSLPGVAAPKRPKVGDKPQ